VLKKGNTSRELTPNATLSYSLSLRLAPFPIHFLMRPSTLGACVLTPTTPLIGVCPETESTLPDSAALHRLITLGVSTLALWSLFNYGPPTLHALFPSCADSLKPVVVVETGPVRLNPSLAQLIAPSGPHIGQWYTLELPVTLGGDKVQGLYKGTVAAVEAKPTSLLLPKTGNTPGDMLYSFADGHYWIWLALKGAAPAWVDP
jgi:hypothetical protein